MCRGLLAKRVTLNVWQASSPLTPPASLDFSSLCYSRRFQTDVKNVTNPKLKTQGITLCNALPYCWLLITLACMCMLVMSLHGHKRTQVKFQCITPVSTFGKKLQTFGLPVDLFPAFWNSKQLRPVDLLTPQNTRFCSWLFTKRQVGTECKGSGGWWEQCGVCLFWQCVAHLRSGTTAGIFSFLS